MTSLAPLLRLLIPLLGGGRAPCFLGIKISGSKDTLFFIKIVKNLLRDQFALNSSRVVTIGITDCDRD